METIKKDNQDERDNKPPSYHPHEQPWIFQNTVNGEPLQTQTHRYYIIEIIKTGSIIVTCPPDKPLTFQAGEIWIRPSQHYIEIPSASYDAISICFNALYYTYCLYPMLSNRKYPEKDIARSAQVTVSVLHLQDDVERLNSLLESTDLNVSVLIRHALHQLAFKILTLMPPGCLPVPQQTGITKKLIADEFSYFLEANYNKRFTVAELGNVMGKSVSSFKRFFAANYQSTPVQWLIRRRLDYAYFLLYLGQYSVDTVAILSGFAETSHFVKQFKRCFEVSPRLLKKQFHPDLTKKHTKSNEHILLLLSVNNQ